MIDTRAQSRRAHGAPWGEAAKGPFGGVDAREQPGGSTAATRLAHARTGTDPPRLRSRRPRPALARHGIGRTILVQAAATAAETRWLLDLARDTPFVAGVVGWTEFTASDAPDAIAALAREPKLVGLHPDGADIADDDWLARASLAATLRR